MLRDLLGLSKEPIELDLSEAAEKLKQHKASKIGTARKKAEGIRSDVIGEFEDLEEGLEELEDFEDSKDRQVINDVVDNIVSDRQEMMNEFEFSEDPEDLYSDLNRFVNEFKGLTQKEAAVLEEAYLQKQISRTIGGLESQRDRLEDFLDSKYTVVSNYRKLKELVERRENLLDQINDLSDEIDQLDIQNIKSEIEGVNVKLSELEKSDEWQKYEFLQDEVEQKRSDKKEIKSDLNTSLNKMERGLKKLIYQAENGDTSIKHVDVLEKLRDKDTGYLLEHPEKTVKALREAEESLPEDLLNDKQQQKFMESISEVKELPDIIDKLESVKSEMKDLRQQVKDHSAPEKRKELTTQRRQLEKELENEKKELQSLEDRLEERESELEKKENRIVEILEESLNREIIIEEDN